MMMLLTLCRLPTADCRLPTADCRRRRPCQSFAELAGNRAL